MNEHTKGLFLALAGILLLSPDTLMVRLLGMEQWPLQMYRGAGTAVCLVLAMACIYRARAVTMTLAIGKTGLLVGVCYAISSLLFVSALYETTVAHTLVIISTAPISGAVLSRVFLKERLPFRTWIAIFAAAVAVAVIVVGDLGQSGSSLRGDLLALLQSFFMASSFVLIRSRPQVSMVPCMALSGILVALISFPLAGSLAVGSDKVLLLGTLVLGILPLSFALLFLAPRYIPAPEVNMVMLLEMILGPLLVWGVIGEKITPATFVGGFLLFAVIFFHSLLVLRREWGLKRTVSR